MGLLDILNGMQNGPRGQHTPSASTGAAASSGGMSPIMTAILGLIAYKAVKSFTRGQPSARAASPGALPGSGTINASLPGNGGGIGNLLKGGLGGLLGGGADGSVLSGGLNDLAKQFQQTGHADTANSWIGTGPNTAISSNDLASSLGEDKIKALMALSGMSREELLEGMSRNLPQVVDHLTPAGRLPTEQEAARLL
jgi:uncharacterized protein YidB (DUF937 family)